MSVIFLCPCAVYIYKIMILLNNFPSETAWPISTNVHVHPTVEMRLKVCSNGHASFTVMPMYGKKVIIIITHSSYTNPRTAQVFILSSVARLEKCCITTAYLQWLFHSVERALSDTFLYFVCYFLIFFFGFFFFSFFLQEKSADSRRDSRQ